METGYNAPDTPGDNNQWNKEADSENTQADSAEKEKTNLAPDTDRDYKVLHKDGSLADLPDQNVTGGGALEGTVGLGT